MRSKMKCGFCVLSLLVACFAFTSCVDDEVESGMEGTVDVSDIAVSGIAERYVCTSYVGEVLSVSPTITSSYADADLRYEWTLLDGTTGNVDDAGDTIKPIRISTERDLRYEVAVAPGVYQLRLRITAKNGYSVFATAALNVVTEFSQGFYILKEMPGGTTDMDLVTIDDELVENVITSTQGAPISGKPLQMNISYDCFYINLDNDKMESTHKIHVTTQDGGVFMYRTTDMLKIFDRSNLKFDPMIPDEFPYTALRTAMDYEVLFTSKGVYVVRAKGAFSDMGNGNSGRYGYPDAECGGSKFLYHDVGSYGGIVFWDEINRSLMCANYNVMVDALMDAEQNGREETQNLDGFVCLDAGICNSSGTGHFILSDERSGERYLYTAQSDVMAVYYTGRRQISATSHLGRSGVFATCGLQGNYVYCVDGGKLYGCNLNSSSLAEVEMPLAGIPSGETVSFITNQYWYASFVSENNFDYFIAGTQHGERYTLYFYKMVGGVPDGEPVKTVTGTGSVRAVRFLSQNFDANDYVFGYALCPNY